ncbi:hypothetical protein MKZ38_008786 [Zalerion maritima]|uniref:Uncharacterized protein n=1 Tax=Zalerion maritima TaxID=339359 RepID=A0AAD5WTA0_9PEZI|nr:hypothetical protein MKZ38_008786 [Zalerion maritima]
MPRIYYSSVISLHTLPPGEILSLLAPPLSRAPPLPLRYRPIILGPLAPENLTSITIVSLFSHPLPPPGVLFLLIPLPLPFALRNPNNQNIHNNEDNNVNHVANNNFTSDMTISLNFFPSPKFCLCLLLTIITLIAYLILSHPSISFWHEAYWYSLVGLIIYIYIDTWMRDILFWLYVCLHVSHLVLRIGWHRLLGDEWEDEDAFNDGVDWVDDDDDEDGDWEGAWFWTGTA